MRIAAWLFWPLIAVATAFAEEPTKDAIAREEQSAYALVESGIKRDFEGALATMPYLEKQDKDVVIEGLKSTYYNKASIYAACMVEIKNSKTAATSTDVDARYKNCVESRLREMVALQTLLINYGQAFSPETTLRCEMEARLFERELLLPPYDFLKGKITMLFDFHAYNQCLRSK